VQFRGVDEVGQKFNIGTSILHLGRFVIHNLFDLLAYNLASLDLFDILLAQKRLHKLQRTSKQRRYYPFTTKGGLTFNKIETKVKKLLRKQELIRSFSGL
jgi:hypothetical protein